MDHSSSRGGRGGEGATEDMWHTHVILVNEEFHKLERVYRDCIKRTRDKTRMIQYTA